MTGPDHTEQHARELAALDAYNPHAPAEPPFDRYDHDPDALAWARARVQASIDRAEGAAANDQLNDQDRDEWRRIGAFMRRELLTREGCVHAAFDERLPAFLKAIGATAPAPSDLAVCEVADLFFVTAYGAAIAEPHPATPDDPPCMVDLAGYLSGQTNRQQVRRLIIHRTLVDQLGQDLTTLCTPTPGPGEEQGAPVDWQAVAVRREHELKTVLARLTALYERWVKAGPPLGVSMSRWWDARLIELRDAITPPQERGPRG